MLLAVAAAQTATCLHGQTAHEASRMADVPRWVADLDAASYETRHQATEKLIATGGLPAIESLQTAVREGASTETQLRAFHILAAIAVSGGQLEEEAAHEAIETIASSSDVGRARRARLILEQVRRTYENRALTRLQELGAKVELNRQYINPLGQGGLVSLHAILSIGDDWHGTWQDLNLLKYLDRVTTVELFGSQITDEAIAPLLSMRGLRRVHFKHTPISDEGFARLVQCPNLEDVRVWYSPLSDKSLETIQKFRSLHQLEIYGTDILPESLAAVEQQLPGVKVVYRRGGLLGVGPKVGVDLRRGCMINKPEEGSGAEKAGLRDGDVIMRYRGHEVTDFESLRDLIQHDSAGDKVEIECLRGRESFTCTVELGEWNRSMLP